MAADKNKLAESSAAGARLEVANVVVVATGDATVRFVLCDWAVRKGLHVIISYQANDLRRLVGEHRAVRLVLYTSDDIGRASVHTASELDWLCATVPCQLRSMIYGTSDLSRMPLWQAIDALMDAMAERLGATSTSIACEAFKVERSDTRSSLAYGPISVRLDDDKVFVDGERNIHIVGQLCDVLKYLLKHPERDIAYSEIDDIVVEARRSTEAHRKMAQRLRVALQHRRDMIVTGHACIALRMPRVEQREQGRSS